LGPPTVTTIASLLATLEDMTAALQREIKETRERQEESEGGDGQTNSALLDRLAELRLVASLQRQIEKRTELVADLAAQGQSAAEVQETLRQLAARQARVYEIAKEIAARTQP
jgi:septal ring factor EnvC (AmiA/AmiB activator)